MLSSVIQDHKKSIVNCLRDSPRLVCMAVSEMLERSRLPRDSAQKVVLLGDSLMDYAASSNQRLRPPAVILDRGLDLSQVNFLGEHPQLMGDLATKGPSGDGTSPAARPLGVGSGRHCVQRTPGW